MKKNNILNFDFGKKPKAKTSNSDFDESKKPDKPLKDDVDNAMNKLAQKSKEPTSPLLKKLKQRLKEPFLVPDKPPKPKRTKIDKIISDDNAVQKPKKIKTGFDASELMRMELPEPKWAIPDILPEGLNILAGKPKMGKSVLSLNIALAIATGGKALGKIDVKKGSVLYLALEDTKRRLQTRLQAMLQGSPAPENLYIETEWPKFGDLNDGLDALDQRIKEISNLRLVIVDTLQKVRPPARKGLTAYAADYEIGCQIKKLADKNNVSVLANHHLRKLESEDVMDDISGTFGLTGSADGTLAFKRKTGQADAVLYIIGRDVDRAEYALKYHPDIWSWELIGDAAEIKSTENRQKIYNTIKNAGRAIDAKEIEALTGIKYRTIRAGLKAFCEEQSIMKAKEYGKYIFINDNL